MNYLIKRFLRGGIAGAVSSMLLIMGSNISSWGELSVWLNALAIAGVSGFITGFLLAVDKWARTESSEKIDVIDWIDRNDGDNGIDNK